MVYIKQMVVNLFGQHLLVDRCQHLNAYHLKGVNSSADEFSKG